MTSNPSRSIKPRPQTSSSSASSRAESVHSGRIFLGIECGATRSTALAVDENQQLIRRVTAGPANLRLLTDRQLVQLFGELAEGMPRPSALGIGMAGALTETDRERILQAAFRVWGDVPCRGTHDLEIALRAAGAWGVRSDASATARSASSPAARVLVLSGTGSCCYGRTATGQTARSGGWGHVLGDRGSGYAIGLRALQAVTEVWDRHGRWPALGARLLRALSLNVPEDLIDWAQSAGKAEVAALTPEVFAAAAAGDALAREVIGQAADALVADAVACAWRLGQKTNDPVEFILAGGVLLHQDRYARLVSQGIRRQWPAARVQRLHREGAWGAVDLAREALEETDTRQVNRLRHPAPAPRAKTSPASRPRGNAKGGRDTSSGPDPSWLDDALAVSPTEQRNPRSMELDRLPLSEAIALMLSEEARVAPAVLAERKAIERAIRLIVRAFRRGGRLFYVGAGTSGRLGVLDASECPPTFQTDPELVQGIIAGGQRALWQSVEGAEDDPAAGAKTIEHRGVRRGDVVVGIAASGRTPFVWGALFRARALGAATVLLCCNPHLRIPARARPNVVIAPDVGPEVLTGSTRLKAGTATKLVLNLLTTLAMVQLGKVRSNLMIDLNPSNTKLRDRAVRIVQTLSGADAEAARRALEAAGWKVSKALDRLRRRRGHHSRTRKPRS